MKLMRGIDSEINKKNYERELQLCQNAGGDIERYRRLSFDVLQLEQIRLGLEKGIDVEKYLNPKLHWMEMENIRCNLETGIDMSKYQKMGYDWLQCNEIRIGLQEGLDVSLYSDLNYLAPQMQEIRKGLERKVDVSKYTSHEYDWFQMREIRRGMEEKLDVSLYASTEFPFLIMRAIRKGLHENMNLVSYAKSGYSGKALMEVVKGKQKGNDITPFLEKGYNSDQLKQINYAYEIGVNLIPYLSRDFHGAQLEEINKGLKREINVEPYAKVYFSWKQMRELRFGLENRVNVALYANPDFSPGQMEEIRKGLEQGLDVSTYSKVYYEPEQMAQMRQELLEDSTALREEMEELLRDNMVDVPKEILAEEESSQKKSEDFLLDSCISVAQDKMKVTLNFSTLADLNLEVKETDIFRLLKEHEVKQGINKKAIAEIVKDKKYREDIVVAEGKAPVDGENGKFLYYFRTEMKAKPKVLENGTVDYKSMELFEMVQKDQLLAEYQPSTAGMFGYDVTGGLLTPKKGKELPPLHGKGFTMTEDRKKYFSSLDGIVELIDGKLNVRNLYTISGDVNASTGNINFIGDVNIMGNIEAGFSVTATGNIVIDGFCEGAVIHAGKDVVIRRGCQGQGDGEIIAGGSITGQFFESARLEAEENIIASYLLNCHVTCAGKLQVEGRKGVILGGYTCAKQGVECFAIGNVAEIKTIVEVGIDKEDMTSYQELVKQIEKIGAEMQTCENALNRLMSQPERDEKTVNLCERLTKVLYTQKQKKKDLLAERQKQMLNMTKQRSARIAVTGTVYPGTVIYMNADPFIVKDNYSNVQFVKHDAQIDMVPR